VKKLKRLREAKGWTEKFRIAADVSPGTRFDEFFEGLIAAAYLVHHVPAAAAPKFEWAGKFLAGLVLEGDAATLREMAEALVVFAHHKPQPDRRIMEALEAPLADPEGACEPGTTISMRDLLRRLREKGFKVNESTERTLRRWAKPLGLHISGPPGRPK